MANGVINLPTSSVNFSFYNSFYGAYVFSEIGNMIMGQISIKSNNEIPANTWTVVGKFNNKSPYLSEIFPAADSGNGQWGGLINITTDGELRVYPNHNLITANALAGVIIFRVN